jgi:hypothetical protein
MGAAADDARIHAVGISSFGRSWGKESNHRGADPRGPRDKFDLSGITPFMCRGASAQAGLRAAGRGGRAGDIGSRRQDGPRRARHGRAAIPAREGTRHQGPPQDGVAVPWTFTCDHGRTQPALFKFGTGFLPPETGASKET